jgi:hypothetical protein
VKRIVVVGLAALTFAAASACTGEANSQPTLQPSKTASTSNAPSLRGQPSQTSVFRQNLPGTSRRECVTVADGVTLVRSGDFVAGDFAVYRQQWRPNLGPGLGKIFWIPADPQPTAALTIIASSADGRHMTYSAGSLAESDAGPLYPSGIPLPTTGTWKLLAQAGDSWGCFELVLR